MKLSCTSATWHEKAARRQPILTFVNDRTTQPPASTQVHFMMHASCNTSLQRYQFQLFRDLRHHATVLRINVWPVGDRLFGAPSKSASEARAPLAPPKGRHWQEIIYSNPLHAFFSLAFTNIYGKNRTRCQDFTPPAPGRTQLWRSQATPPICSLSQW
jgi:hypothetical protein